MGRKQAPGGRRPARVENHVNRPTAKHVAKFSGDRAVMTISLDQHVGGVRILAHPGHCGAVVLIGNRGVRLTRAELFDLHSALGQAWDMTGTASARCSLCELLEIAGIDPHGS